MKGSPVRVRASALPFKPFLKPRGLPPGRVASECGKLSRALGRGRGRSAPTSGRATFEWCSTLDRRGRTKRRSACSSVITVLPDGRLRLDEDWALQSKPGAGTSAIEEEPPSPWRGWLEAEAAARHCLSRKADLGSKRNARVVSQPVPDLPRSAGSGHPLRLARFRASGLEATPLPARHRANGVKAH
jgi:hypothetical protein